MNTRIGAALIFFISSYFPLAIIQFVYGISDKSWNSKICTELIKCQFPEIKNSSHNVSFLFASALCVLIFLVSIKSIKPTYRASVINAKLVQSDFVNYSLPYIVSFMGMDLSSPQKIVGFYIFMFTLFWTNYKSGHLMLNPILIALNWKLYEVEVSIDNNTRSYRVLSRSRIIPATGIKYAVIDEVLIRK